MVDGFDSVNPYDGINFISARSPEELCRMLNTIKTQIKIIEITAMNNRYTAFITGDLRIKRIRKENKNGG